MIRKIITILTVIIVLSSCSMEGSVYRIQYPEFAFTPYTFPSGDETGHAEVTFLTAHKTDFPKTVEINGQLYYVAVFNGYNKDEHLADITQIEVDDCIQAINSHAYEKATAVTEMSIPNVISLGMSSLPENLVSLTVHADAIDTVGTRPLNESLPNPDRLETLTITGNTRYPIDLSGMGGDTSSLKAITIDGNASWPVMPHLTQEGMKFLGWFTSDPTVDPDAIYAEVGTKPSTIPMTVYPYFTPGVDEPTPEPEKPVITAPSLNVIKIFVYGIDRELMSYSKDDRDRYVISIDTTENWTCNWTINGDIDTSTHELVYTISEAGVQGRIQVIGYISDAAGNAIGAVLFELKG